MKHQIIKYIIIFANFTTGFVGLVSEYLLADIATNLLSDSAKKYSLVISLFIAAMGLGAYAQKYIAQKNITKAFWLGEMMLATLTVTSTVILTWSFAYLDENVIYLISAWVVAIGALVGMEIPLIARMTSAMYMSDSESDKDFGSLNKVDSYIKRSFADINLVDYLGSFVAGAVWLLFLHGKMHLGQVSSIIGIITIVVATITYLMYEGKKHHFQLVVGIAVVGLSYTSYINYSHIIDWEKILIQKLYDNKIVSYKQSKLQKLVLTYEEENENYELFINGNKQFASVDEHIYHENLVHPVMGIAKKHDHILVLGGGDGMAVRELLKYADIKSIELVDLDPAMTDWFSKDSLLSTLNSGSLRHAKVHRTAASYLSSRQQDIYVSSETSEGKDTAYYHGSVQVVNYDAKSFLDKVSHQKYDVIIIDLPDPSIVEIVRLYSVEMFMSAYNNLAEEGVVVMQSTSPYHATDAFWNIELTMRTAGFYTLPYHENVPSFGDWGWIIGSKTNKMSIRWPHIQMKHLTTQVFAANQVFAKDYMPKEDSTSVNTCLNPTLLTLYNEAGWRVE
jgi:spermidine synthase